MNVLIIGGSRFVGPVLIKELLAKNHQLTVFNRGQVSTKYPSEVRYVQGDRNSGFNIKQHYDVVIDMCAYNGAKQKRP